MDITTYKGTEVRFDGNNINLTNMWRAAGGAVNKEPWSWERLPNTQQFLETVTKKLNLRLSQVWNVKKGRYGGTFAHWQIALAYAKYLSPEFHMWANQVVKERFEEMENPEKGLERSYERAVEQFQKKHGMTKIEAEQRVDMVMPRKTFASMLFRVGAGHGGGIAHYTGAMTKRITGKYPKEIAQGKDKARDVLVKENPLQALLLQTAEMKITEVLEKRHYARRPQHEIASDIRIVTSRIAAAVEGIDRDMLDAV